MEVFDRDKSYNMKGIAILLLLFHHLFLVKERLDENGIIIEENIYELLFPKICQARICVWIFVFLSAYGLTKKWDEGNKNVSHFIIKYWVHLMRQWWIVMIGMAILYKTFCGSICDLYQHSWKLFMLDFIEWNDFFGYPRILGSWYICFAQLLIISIPVFCEFCRKYGVFTILMVYIFMNFCGDGIMSTAGGAYIQYLPTAIGGVIAAQSGVMNRVLIRCRNKWLKVVECFGLMISIIIFVEIKYRITDINNIRSMISLIIVLLMCILFSKYFEMFHWILNFLGRHSSVIFMTNVFFYINFPKLIYFSKDPVGSYSTLLVVSLLYSYFIKWVCKKVHYNEKFDWMLNQINIL